MHGKSYDNLKNETVAARSVKCRCSHALPKSFRAYRCYEVNDAARDKCLNYFWALSSWESKKAYIKGLIHSRRAMRRRKNTLSADVSAVKNEFYDCFVAREDGVKVKVCRRFFLNTLDISLSQFYRWLSSSVCDPFAQDDDQNVANNKPDPRRDTAIEWIDQLPKVPSHYCRASSSKQYVDSSFQSESHMHRLYTDYAKTKQQKPLCRQLFASILESKKVGIHAPRKDQCDLCSSHAAGNISQTDYEDHIVKKEEARIAKYEAKNLCSDTTVVVTMDVQSVLLAPKLLASAVYYKRKLQVHNLTIYRLNDSAVHLYVWHEADGGVTSNEFTSCISDYIRMLPATVTRVILISDGCAYQNRNRVLASCLRDISLQGNRVIEQLYLEKGHTMMEADSVHSTLDKLFKSAVIYTPSDYTCLMQQARPQKPYVVKAVDFKFFSNFEELATNLSSIRPGTKAGDAAVIDIRGLKYQDGAISYKLHHPDEWKILHERAKPTRGATRMLLSPPPLFSEPKKIKKDKFNNLQELKILLPLHHHNFYDSLTHD